MTGVDRGRLSTSLEASARALRLPISAAQVEQLIEFVELLSRWNATYNLTAIRDPRDMLTHHVVDCLAAVPPLRRELTSEARNHALDVGSGGGLPGVVFAVMQPQLAITCIDSVGKKSAFVQQVAASLGLRNLEVRHARVERLAGEARYGLIVSRAFASLSDFTRLTLPLLAEGGVWMAMKGKPPHEELAALAENVEVFHVEPLHIPELDVDRCLVWMQVRPSAASE